MPKPLTVDGESKHFIEQNGVKIELPKPADQMTSGDWTRIAAGKNSPLRKVPINSQTFTFLHVALKEKGNYIPIWLYAGGKDGGSGGRALDSFERAIQMGARAATIEDLDEASQQKYSGSVDAGGHIRVMDVMLSICPIVTYYAMQADHIRRSNDSIQYQSQEAKAYEGWDMPHEIKGNKDAPIYQTNEHSVRYSDRPSGI